MKKTLVAMAALAATSAFAQSTVEIYGIIDQSYAVTTTKADDGQGGSLKLKQTTTGNQSGSATQRIGFRGTEDLGGGTSAIFQIENSLSAGNAGTNGFGSRPTFVGLSDKAMGTLTLGRQDSPMLKAVVPQLAGGANNAVGQMNWSGFTINEATGAAPVATAGLARMAGHTDFVTNNNAINYKTATFSGLSAEVQFGKTSGKLDATDGTNALGTAAKATTTGMNVMYEAGPLTVNAATNKNKTAANAALTIADTGLDAAVTANAEAVYKTNYLGATYDLGVAKLSLTTIKDKYTTATTTAFNNKGNTIGAQIPVNAKVATWVSYGKGKRQFNNGADEFKQTSYQLGATYSFSKRTAAYGVYGSQKLAGNNADNTGSFKQNQYVFGLRHSF